ncbi:MAG: carboxypeptidase regulatory-like domain-containing protein [Bacteroidales bacterium]
MKPINLIRIITLIVIPFFLTYCTEDKLGTRQKGMINGRVLDERDQTPVVDAEVIISPSNDTLATDFMGYFEKGELNPGEYTVSAVHEGFVTQSEEVLVSPDETTTVIMYLLRTDGNTFEFTDSIVPIQNQEEVSLNPVFRWGLGYYPPFVTYTLEVFESGSQQAYRRLENLTDTFALVTGLKFGTDYQWRVTAQDQNETVTGNLHDFSTLAFPQNPVMYAKRVDGISQIFVTDINGSSHNQITHNNFHSWRPMLNPQKDQIAFLSSEDLNPQLYVMDLNGESIIKLTNIPTGGYYNKGVGFSWFPDGERLVFSSYNRLYRINSDGSGLLIITAINPERHFREVDWSAENDKIVALTVGVNRYDARIVLMNINGSGMEEIVSGLQGALENPGFSSDGQYILYTYDVSGFQSNDGRQLDARIFRYNLANGEITDLSQHKPAGTNDLVPRFTNNDNQIVFYNARNLAGSSRNLYIMPPETTSADQRILLVEDVEMPDW